MMKKNKTKPQVILGEMREEINCHIFELELRQSKIFLPASDYSSANSITCINR